jgi:predicted Rdx family selenoprotein
LAADIKASFGVQPELVAGSNGVFDVTVDDTLIFSKGMDGDFPRAAQLIADLRQML